ncbi:MAG: ferredoxin-thioredoxin reductase catalytic domain-containing protein [Sphaerochaetaceae bacterium]|nr:ferredoxin-thioredoxin reductase catalytic domain-containing protein [Sphaerochaetaceae bacterium]
MSETQRIDVSRFVRNVATKKGWVLNQDPDFLASLIEGLEANLLRLGYLQCPCRLSWDDPKKDKDIICPCIYAGEDIAQYGHCFCSLYLSEEFARSAAEPASIPERRPEHLFP